MTAALGSWGRYPPFLQCPHDLYWRDELPSELAGLSATFGSTLPYGNGRSYGDSCLAISDHVLYMRSLARFISVDWNNGIIIAESGVTLDEILMLAIPHGWFLQVTPGTKYVTLGGAIANDVHGKNNHVRGTFGCHVRSFGLVRSDSSRLVCSSEKTPKLYAATIGGLGLTGVIEWVELQLLPIKSSFMETTTIRFESLSEFFKLSDELDTTHEYTVAWIDCLAKGSSLGRGVFIAANHAQDGGLSLNEKRKIEFSFTPPISGINQFTLRLFNASYFRSHKAGSNRSVTNYESFFYPLDRILSWNRIYGPSGFQQYQCVIPEIFAENVMHELLTTISNYGTGSFLAVLKKCGNVTSPGLLSFPMPGVSLALDFPQKNSSLDKLFDCLDEIVRKAGGRLYPAKDAHMKGEDFRIFYPQWEQLESLRDPVLCSRFWKRVTSL